MGRPARTASADPASADPAAGRLATLRRRHPELLESAAGPAGGGKPAPATGLAAEPPAGGAAGPPGERLPSGWPALDAWLGGGWPLGGLVELRGAGRSSLALGAVRCAQALDLAPAWVDGTGGFCPATARLDLARLDLLRVPAGRGPPARATQALRAADLLLRARAHGVVVLDLPPGPAPAAAFFRLVRLARRAPAALLLLQGHRRCLAGSATPLLLEALLHAEAPLDTGLQAPALALTRLRQRDAGAAHGTLLLRPEDFERPRPRAGRAAS